MTSWSSPEPIERAVAAAVRDEHAVLEGRIAGLVELADELDELDDEEARRRLEEAVSFLRDELLVHADVEDAVLYPVVDGLLRSLGGATVTMSMDHSAIARRTAVLAEAVERLATDGRHEARRTLIELNALVTHHLAKEEEAYLPLFGRLTADQHDEVSDAMRRSHDERATGG